MVAYTRQSTISDGDTITAALFNDEYNQLLSAFSYASSGTTGHKHDGTAGEGGNIPQIGDQDFLNKIVTDSTNNRFGIFVQVSSSAVEQIRIQDGAIVPVTDNDIDLGTSSVEFKDAFFDGTVTTDALVADTADINGGTVDGATIGASSATTGVFTTIQGSTITATTAFVPDASDGAALGTSSLEFSDLFLADGAVISFGDDDDVTLTHVADTGLLLSGTSQLQFNDASQNITAPSATVLDINATDEIELNATLVDINANVEVSGTLTVAGAVDFGDAALSNVGAVQLDSIAGDGDTNTSITFSGSDVITIATGGTTAMTIDASQNVAIAGDLTITGDDLTMGTNTSGMLLIADGTNFNPTAVTSLSEISTVANDDVFLAIDTSGGGLKKIARSAIVSGLATSGAISNVVEDTSPQLGANLDTNSHNILIDDAHFIGDENGNEQIIFQTTSSAVNQIDVTNAATGNAPEISATGDDTNISLKLTPKGSGQVVIDGNVGIETGVIDLKNGGSQSAVRLYCESSNAHYAAIQAPAHSDFSGNVTLTLPATTDTLTGIAATQTLTNKTLTSPVLNTATVGTSIVPSSADGATLGTASAEFSDLFLADGGIIKFGNDQDVTLTHVADTGLLLNSTMQLQFNDASQNINAPSATVLDINATDEIELNATLVDINANLDVSGTYTGGGLMTTGGNIVIPDAGNIGSATDTDAMAIASNGVVTFSAVPSFPNDTIETADVQDNAITLAKMAGLARGKIIVGDSNGDPSALALGSNGQVLQSDGNDLVFGSVATSAALDDITTGDAASTLATSAGDITIDAQGSNTDIILKGTDGSSDITGIKIDMSETAQVQFPNDSQALAFGADQDVLLTHLADSGLILSSDGNSTAFRIDENVAGSSSGPSLNLVRSSDSPADNDFGGAVNFFMENDNNETFTAAQIKAQAIDVSDGSEDGQIRFDTMSGGTVSNAMIIDSDNTVTVNNDLKLNSDAAVLGFGADNDVLLTHVADTGLTLSSGTNATTLQIDSNAADDSIAPKILFNRTTDSPADNDPCGALHFDMENDNNQQFQAATIQVTAKDVSDGAEDGQIEFKTMSSGSLTYAAIMDQNNDFVVYGSIRANDDILGGMANPFSSSYRVNLLYKSGRGGILGRAVDTSTNYPYTFQNSSGTTVGYIYSTSSTVIYYAASDYRLKENIVDITDGITKVKQLKPRRFNFKTETDQTVDGFIAHEVESVVPSAVVGEKDAVDDAGEMEAQMLDKSHLVPVLTAALQEAVAKIEALEARVTTLEG